MLAVAPPGLFSSAARDAQTASIDWLPACLHYRAKSGILLSNNYCRILMVGRWPTFFIVVSCVADTPAASADHQLKRISIGRDED